MAVTAKIHLSPLETELIKNTEWILTKHTIINKVYQLFGELNEIYKQVKVEENVLLPGFHKNSGGKISKGENYESLPYVMMDYPALFSRENIFAIRTMFWWGNFFSITLHASGERFKLKGDFFKMISYLQENNFFICVNENEWSHSFEITNYITARDWINKGWNKLRVRIFLKFQSALRWINGTRRPHSWKNLSGR